MRQCEQVVLSFHFDPAFTFLHEGTSAGSREDSAKPEPSSANALGERALRHKLDGDLLAIICCWVSGLRPMWLAITLLIRRGATAVPSNPRQQIPLR
jgi:hypothetical protein